MRIFVWLLLCSGVIAQADEKDDLRPLFNGRDLSGWVLVNTPPQTWRFEDGLLVCSGRPIGEIRTEKMYQNFVLELEWRHMVPRGNAGVFVWADDITAAGQPFHRGVEVQVLENSYGNTRGYTTHGDIFPIHGAKMTPVNGRGGSRAFPTENRSRPSPQWNHYRIECRDGNISLAVNGKVVTRGTECSPRKGYICLESEGGVVHYRNVRIQELPDSPVDEKDTAIANRGFRSLYTGLDLTGWKTTAADNTWQSKDWVLSYTGQASGERAALQTTSRVSAAGLICDFKLKEDAARVIWELVSADGTQTIDTADAGLSSCLARPGRWNRIEVIRGENASVRLNGQTVDQTPTNASDASLRLIPTGAVDFANIYVREAR
ncbi:MAG: DUF1080 domain-containing protein [Planctomycetaceae bacterium]|nr:DUF1080 domain-containing protein [Planctomycetaceae bacterium]